MATTATSPTGRVDAARTSKLFGWPLISSRGTGLSAPQRMSCYWVPVAKSYVSSGVG